MPIASRFGGNSLRAFGQRGAIGTPRDQYFNYVTMLLSTTSLGRQNNNLFSDSSSAYNPVARNGNPTQGVFNPFGSNWSAYFDGSGDYLRTPSSSATTLVGTMNSSTNLTIECWINPSAYNNNSNNFPGLIGDMDPTSQVDYWSWGLTNTGTLMLYWYISGSQYRAYTTSTVSLNVWSHIALNISAGAITMYINGVSQALTGTTTLGAVSGSLGYLAIGQWNNAGSTGDAGNYTGYISNLRIVKASTYTSNFTPSTTPLSAIASTSLLACHTNRLIDGSSNALTLTRGGNVTVSKYSPFLPVAALKYNQDEISKTSTNFPATNNGSSNLNFGHNAALSFTASNDLTVEAWVYLTAHNTYSVVCSKGNSSTREWSVNINSTTMYFYWSTNGSSSTDSSVSASYAFQLGVWYHIAACKSGSNVRLFVDGTQIGTTGTFTSVYNGSDPFRVGTFMDFTGISHCFAGHISNLRVVKGTALYTSNFTVPTAPLTAVSGTSLLTCQNATFTDSSTNNLTAAINGSVTTTGNSPFISTGYWSNFFDNTGDYLTAPANAALALGTGNFTLEAWVYGAGAWSTDPIFECRSSGSSSAGYAFLVNSSGYLNVYHAGNFLGASTTALAVNTWYHVALVRSGTGSNQTTYYINGVAAGTITLSANLTDGSTNETKIGGSTTSGEIWGGYISNARIVKGTAVYTSNFTVPTAPLTAISGTSLLTCQNSNFKDNSSNALTITRNGDVSIQTYNPFYSSTLTTNGGSGYFDGDGDNLTIPDTELFEFGSGEFSIDCWVYLTTLKGYQAFVSKPGSADYYGYNLYIESNNTIGFISGNGSWTIAMNGSFVPTAGQWYHLAVTRKGNQWRLFINGNLNATTNNSFSIPNFSTPLYVGKYPYFPSYNNAQDLSGYMSELRIIKGGVPSLFDTSSTTTGTQIFTPPTAPYTGSESLTGGAPSLLMHFGNAGAYDSSGNNDLETITNARVSTTTYKYGTSSMYFDGGTTRLQIPITPLMYLGTTYTIEAWAYSETTSGARGIFNISEAFTGGFTELFVGMNTSGVFVAENRTTTNGAVATITGPSVSANTWYHVALSVNNTSARLFVNGTQVGSTTTFNEYPIAKTSFAAIGGWGHGWVDAGVPTGGWVGFIDDLRITKGVARYTSNFTPPSRTLPTR